jgi:anti-anti-sigma factor
MGKAAMQDRPPDSIEVHYGDHCAVLVFPTEVDSGNSELVRTRCLQLVNEGVHRVVLDLTKCEFCDSTGVNVIFRCHIRARAAGVDLSVRLPRLGLVRRICHVTGVTRVVPLEDGDGATASPL